jgi:YVTN family beta-propeller protein
LCSDLAVEVALAPVFLLGKYDVQHFVFVWRMQMRFPSFVVLIVCACFGAAEASVASLPVGVVAVGDSPFALALDSSNTEAVVVNLFPARLADGHDGPNIKIIDITNRTLTNQFLAGTRLVAVAVAGTTALIINEDQNAVRLIDVTTAKEIAVIPVGSRPSNVAVLNANLAVVTNGTSGDISFIDIPNRRVLDNPIGVGNDPRAVAVNPANNSRYAYVAASGDDKLAVIDMGVLPQKVIATVTTGKNPVAIAISPDNAFAVVANLTNNTATIMDISNPASPNPVASIPVCGAPVSVSAHPLVTPDKSLFYIGCESSPFFVVLDAKARAVVGVVEMCGDVNNTPVLCTSSTFGIPSSGILPSSDGKNLYVLEFQNNANLRIYDLTNLKLDPPQSVDIPGEPQLNFFMDSTGTCASSFYISQVDLAPGQKEGLYSQIVSVKQGVLTGGFNLGGAFAENGGSPGFGQFKTPSGNKPTNVTIKVDAQNLPGTTGTVGLQVVLYKEATASSGRIQVATKTGGSSLQIDAPSLDPGTYYTVVIKSLAGSPRGTFQMQLIAPDSGFEGGVVVGGFAIAGVTGYGGYCNPASQNVKMEIQGVTTFGSVASGDLILSIKDPTGKVIRTVNNSLSSFAYLPPAAPAMPGSIDLYVDANASTSAGIGTSANPFKSITAAVAKAAANQTIFVRKGTYSPSKTGEVFPIDNFPIGLQLIGAGAADVVVDMERSTPPTGKTPNGLIVLTSNVRVAGFTIKGAQQLGLFVCGSCGGSTSPSNVVIENNWLTFNGRSGLSSANAPGLIVRNNLLTLNSENGMVITNAGKVGPLNPPANTCPASPSGSYGVYVINNTVADARVDGILLSQGGNVCVYGNSSVNNGSSGIEFNNRPDATVPNQTALNGVVVNNILTNNGGVQYPYAGTGVLATEGTPSAPCKIDIIQDNTFDRNHPTQISIFLNAAAGIIQRNQISNGAGYGIVVQRNSTVDTITNNSTVNHTYAGLFVENQARVTTISSNVSTGNGSGLQVLTGSQVTTVDSNGLDRNGVGIEVTNQANINSAINNSITKNSLGNDTGAGVFVTRQSTIGNFTNTVTQNTGQSGIVVDSSILTISGATEVSDNSGNGLQVQNGATLTVGAGAAVSRNRSASGAGIFLDSGSKATLTGVTVDGNNNAGIQAGGSGTTATLNSGMIIRNTTGYGLNAQAGGAISCSTVPGYSNNSKGNTLGNTSGC